LVELAAPEPPTAPEELDAEDPFLAELSEANRLARLGDVDGVSRLVDRAKQAEGIGKQQLGWLEGGLGNALQNAQRDEEAVDEYEVAANLLEEAGDAEAVSQALSYRAVSLRRLGRLEDAERALRAALPNAPSEEERETIELALANTLVDRYASSKAPPPGLLDEARDLFGRIVATTNRIHTRGAAFQGLSNVDLSEGNLEAALEHRRAALRDLRRANAPEVDAVEASLRELEQ